jgi:hypothetical protein
MGALRAHAFNPIRRGFTADQLKYTGVGPDQQLSVITLN